MATITAQSFTDRQVAALVGCDARTVKSWREGRRVHPTIAIAIERTFATLEIGDVLPCVRRMA
jgi:hypothetical protein